MIDLHTHILPQIDDGSSSVRESIEMLKSMKRYGIEKVVATPHFYARKDTPESFLNRRQKSMHNLTKAIERLDMGSELPEVILGAEVHYFSGMSQCQAIRKLTMEGTNLLLLELPYRTWDESILEEVEAIERNLDLQVVIAHLDRYYTIGRNKGYIQELLQADVRIQVNIDAFLTFIGSRRMLKLLSEQRIYGLGSDAHNTKERQPRWAEFWKYVEKKKLKHLLVEMSK